ncbi:glucans biosynthesis protein [Rubripirellula obstinata]|uniref:Glucans biosynthesis protein n=2 Tax=Rubripirellula obstinata TaxID=406547 RepID=A0A5B1CF07_9BACT|nr:glucans biosynthesis protein [Rubripirellula obstinata]
MNILPMTSDSSREVHPQAGPPTNFVGIDAIRAFAAIAVVVLHALVPYLKHPMPGLVWSVSDSPSSFADGVFWSIELFVMPLFLIIAGVLTFQSWQRRNDANQLVRSRAKRLLRPLFFAVLVILPIDLYIWVLGWVSEGLVPLVKMKSLKFDDSLSKDLWGLSHLWFLHYLFSYVVIFAGFMVVRQKIARLKNLTLSMPAIVACCWIIASLVILFRPEVIWGFQHAFAPVASKWIYNGCFFVIGVAIANFDPSMIRLRSISPRWAAVAACTLLLTVPLGIWSLDSGSEISRASSVTLAVMTATSSLLVSVMLVSMALRRIAPLPRSIQYVAAGSFWIYLIHHPVLSLVHIDLKYLLPTASPMLKATIATLIATGVSLATYEVFIRKSRLGGWLGMNWVPVQEDDRESILSFDRQPDQPPIRRAA